tara:strand:+ start:368 stop:508 length:141 start_codon:yes stop_codon:yes gene_type:complete
MRITEVSIGVWNHRELLIPLERNDLVEIQNLLKIANPKAAFKAVWK